MPPLPNQGWNPSSAEAPQQALPTALLAASALVASWATTEDDVREAQSLRYRVFMQELGAACHNSGTDAGLDIDAFDPYCEHLLVRATTSGDIRHGPVIGTCRVMSPSAVRRAGGSYTESEFDLTPLHVLRPRTLELGRSCVDPAWRSGSVIMLLWSELGRSLKRQDLDTLIGCASVALDHKGCSAAALWQSLRHHYLAAPQWLVTPRIPLPLLYDINSSDSYTHQKVGAWPAITPALIKGYLRCGVRLLGPPALDTAFNTADLPMMLRINELTPRYRRHFLGS